MVLLIWSCLSLLLMSGGSLVLLLRASHLQPAAVQGSLFCLAPPYYTCTYYAQSSNSDHPRISLRKAWIRALRNNLRIVHTILGFMPTVCKVCIYNIVARPRIQTLSRACHPRQKYYEGCQIDRPRDAWLCVQWACIMNTEILLESELAAQG